MRHQVPPELGGERLDRVVARLGGVSRAVAGALVDEGGVTVDGLVGTRRQKVSAGSVVEFPEPSPPAAMAPEAVAFDVRYEDRHLVVVDKPAGLVVHPGAGRATGTLAAGILARWPAVRGVGAEGRWGIVHRLDRDTSGLLVVALDHEAYEGLRAAIGARMVTRQYLALVHGTPAVPTGTVEAGIARNPSRPTRTHYRVVSSWGEFSLLEVTLDTGRTHQIRVHLGSIGLPIAGDRTYGRPGGSPRVFLHAHRLRLAHPVTGEQIDVESPLPDDLAAVLAGLGTPHAG